MNEFMKLTKKEQVIMEMLWNTNDSMCIADMIKQNKALQKNSTSVLLKRMLDKNLVYVAEIKKNEKALTQYYKPIISQDKFLLETISRKNALQFAVAFIKGCSNDDLDLLEKHIHLQRKKEY